MLRSLGLWASLATFAANAILIPSTVSIEGIPNSKVGTTSLVDPYRQLLMVPCVGCKYAQPLEEGDGFVWTEGVENGLLFNISVGSDPTTLQLNGVQFYPPAISFETPPYIAQVPASVSLVDVRENPSRYITRPLHLTSWSFAAVSSQTTETGEEILDIMLSVKALEQQPVTVPDITLTALKDTEGRLVILRTETTMAEAAPTDGQQKECQEWLLLCKWRNIIADRLEALKSKVSGHGCGHKKMLHGHARPGMLKDSEGNPGPAPPSGHEDHPHGPPGHHRRPGHHRWGHHGHHRHHKHHKLHRILHAVGRVMLTVFVPILIGVIAGMVLYMLGYLIGATLGFVLTRLLGVRRGQGYEAVAVEEETFDEEAPRSSIEKELYIVEDAGEAPPQYVEVEANEAERK